MTINERRDSAEKKARDDARFEFAGSLFLFLRRMKNQPSMPNESRRCQSVRSHRHIALQSSAAFPLLRSKSLRGCDCLNAQLSR
jgi:hypothetical protein